MRIYPYRLTPRINGSPFSSLLFSPLLSDHSLNNNYYPRRTVSRTLPHPQTLNPTLQLTMTSIHVHPPVPSPSSNRRPTCHSCAKPSRFCLCVRIQNPNLPNSIAVTILQHTLEKKHPLNSARIASLGLQNLVLASVSDVNVHARFSIRFMVPRDFDESSFYFTVAKYGEMESPPQEMVNLEFATEDALSKGFVVKKIDNAGCEEFEISVPAGSMLLFPSERAVGIQERRRKNDHHKQVKNLIVLDGTWAKAKRMYKENPWLNLLPHLKLEMEMTTSLYSEVRSQPRDGYLSTIESIVYALKGLGDETDGLDQLLQVFGSMVEDQRRCKNQRRMTGTTSN